MNTKKKLIRLMLAGIFILAVCFYFSTGYCHTDLPAETYTDEFSDVFDIFDIL